MTYLHLLPYLFKFLSNDSTGTKLFEEDFFAKLENK